MAPSRPRAAYTSDQRQMSVVVYASSRGGTRLTVTWAECQAGEEKKREATVLRWQWPASINTRADAIACLIRMVELLRDQAGGAS